MTMRLLNTKYNNDNFSSSEIKRLLNRNYVNEFKSGSNMVSMIRPYKKFLIGFKTYDRFFNRYEKILKRNPELISGICEIPGVITSSSGKKETIQSPIVVDVDFVNENLSLTELYSEETLLNFVKVYQQQIDKHCINVNKKHLTCVVLTKPPYKTRKNNKLVLKHGFHLQFPEISILGDVKKSIRNNVSQITRIEIDDCDMKPWLLYGSCKSKTTGRYKVRYCVEYNGNRLNVDDYLKKIKLYDIFTDSYYTPTCDNLPRVLSLRSCNEKMECCYDGKEIITIQKPVETKQPQQEKTDFKPLDLQQEKKSCNYIIRKLKEKTSDDYNSWYSVGCSIYNIFKDKDEDFGLELFKKFSMKSEKYDEISVENYWYNNFPKSSNRFSKGTLMFYFKQDK